MLFLIISLIYANCVSFTACNVNGPCTILQNCSPPTSVGYTSGGNSCSGYSCTGSYQVPPQYLAQQRQQCKATLKDKFGEPCEKKSREIHKADYATCNNYGYATTTAVGVSSALLAIAGFIPNVVSYAGKIVIVSLAGIGLIGASNIAFYTAGQCKESADFLLDENLKGCRDSVTKVQNQVCNF